MSAKKAAEELVEGEIKGAPRAILEGLFEDYYKHRYQLYWMNLLRGVFFGFGSVVGGTIVLALFFWILSLFQQIPFLTEVFQSVESSLQEARKQ